jgi:hypothetical protein
MVTIMNSSGYMMIDPDVDDPVPPQAQRRSGRNLLDRMVAWILRPIEFPGKWPAIETPPHSYNTAKRYNSEVPAETKLPDGE